MFNTLIPRWPTDGQVAGLHCVVRLVMHDCTGGLSTRYPTADSMVTIGTRQYLWQHGMRPVDMLKVRECIM